MLILHAEDDGVVPFRLGETLFEEAVQAGKTNIRWVHSPEALWNRSRNRRNRNFLTNGTGTVIIYGSGTGTRYKILVFDFLHLKFFFIHILQ